MLGVPHCIAMCNGTVALEIAIRAAGLSGEVIVPSFTFVATAHALQWQEITPVFCDVDPRTHNIDPARVEELITPRTTGILGGAPLGPARAGRRARREIAGEHGLRCCSTPPMPSAARTGGRMIGGFGTAEVFSFHATKFVNTFEGGAIVTDDEGFADVARLMRNFGFADYDEVEPRRHERQDERGRRGDGADLAGVARRVRRGQPAQLRGLPRGTRRASTASS